ncbi:MAG: hypothetical protein U5N55_05175 [Cypionkella sp.]|nr:hypothetical protein [Cypionkella sp.]
MFDAVFNHTVGAGRVVPAVPGATNRSSAISSSPLRGTPDLSQVVRPRALPLLTEFPTARGPEKVWTTFSADQVDVNVQESARTAGVAGGAAVLHGARRAVHPARRHRVSVEEVGTPCIHLPQTHAVIQLMRAVLDEVAPARAAHHGNQRAARGQSVSYFGDGTNEAQLVYNFALPPLVLHALAAWRCHPPDPLGRALLEAPSDRTTFFNFLASHDGIGMNPARGILRHGGD